MAGHHRYYRYHDDAGARYGGSRRRSRAGKGDNTPLMGRSNCEIHNCGVGLHVELRVSCILGSEYIGVCYASRFGVGHCGENAIDEERVGG